MNKIVELLCSLLCILSVHAVDPMPKKFVVRRVSYSNKYYVPPNETPDFTTLDDYRGRDLLRQWEISGGKIVLDQEVTNEIRLTWRRDNTAVDLHKYVTIAIDQQWQFGDATITINNSVAGAIYQKWNLGDKWYHYERSVTGQVISEGTASANDLARYKREIDMWCQANRRFFPRGFCSIYDK